jgi:5'-3' exonuclease
MGVPGFISWLRNECKDKIILTKLPDKPDILYIDGNCLVHPKCNEVIEYYADKPCQTQSDLELLMFRRITRYIEYLINYTQARTCYFAIDGVAPLAKINQQRKRRYKTMADNEMKNELKLKYNLPVQDQQQSWNNTVITPGTEWMERLHQYLLRYIKHYNSTNTVQIIYSSYHSAGEGEHKILKHIKDTNLAGLDTNLAGLDTNLAGLDTNLANLDNSTKQPIVIYGLDADLFFLAMASNRKNIFLLREETHFSHGKPERRIIHDILNDVEEDMKYVSIELTKSTYTQIITDIIYRKCKAQFDITYWHDFIILCYLLGNDFLPHLPTIDIQKSGLTIIIDAYTDLIISLESYLVHIEMRGLQKIITINNIFLQELFRLLGDQEEKYFTVLLPEFKDRKQRQKDKNRMANNKQRNASAKLGAKFGSSSSSSPHTRPNLDAYNAELWNIENMQFEIDDPIQLGLGTKEEWIYRYYEHYISFRDSKHYENQVSAMCYSYIEGLYWVALYYFDECPAWAWQYPTTHAPFVSDLYKYMLKSKLDISLIKFTLGKPLEPCAQLLAVLPPSCKNILPYNYQKLVTDANSPIIDMFPSSSSVELDMIHKDLFWMCIPMLPYLDVGRLSDALVHIKLTEEEYVRNISD